MKNGMFVKNEVSVGRRNVVGAGAGAGDGKKEKESGIWFYLCYEGTRSRYAQVDGKCYVASCTHGPR